MAFFSDGKKEYISLNLDPLMDGESYIFQLTSGQSKVSIKFLPLLTATSITVFFLSFVLLITELSNLSRLFFDRDLQELAAIIFAAVACLTALSIVFFFLWVKQSPNSLLTNDARRSLIEIKVIRARSWMSYLVFALNMAVPFIAIFALPDGFAGFLEESSSYSGWMWVFLFQLFILAFFIMIFLIRRILFFRAMR